MHEYLKTSDSLQVYAPAILTKMHAGIRRDTLQPGSSSDDTVRSQPAMAEEMQGPRHLPSKQAVRLRVQFQNHNKGSDQTTDPIRIDHLGNEGLRSTKPVTWADVVEEEREQRGLPMQTGQRHKRGADQTQEARDPDSIGDAAPDEDAAEGPGDKGMKYAGDRRKASQGDSAARVSDDDGDLDEDAGPDEGDSKDELAANDELDDEEQELEDAGTGRRASEAEAVSEVDEQGTSHLGQASLRARGGAAAAKEDSLDRVRQPGGRKRGLPRGKTTKKKLRLENRKGAAESAGKRRSAVSGKDADRVGKNKTVTVRPALLGFNLTWGILEGEETLYKQDVAAAVSPVLGAAVQSDRAPVVQLTAALANSRSRDGIVIVTWASAAYLDFLRNWVHQITLLEVENFLIGALLLQLSPEENVAAGKKIDSPINLQQHQKKQRWEGRRRYQDR
jgi:hypothetical protein